MDLLCAGGSRAGLAALCVTDHYDRDGHFEAASYLAAYEKARAAIAITSRLDFMMGVEIGEGHLDPEGASALLAELPFDFVLGSCHYIEGMADFYLMDYESGAHCDRLIGQYAEELRRMITWGAFDVLGHLTYPLRYMKGRGGFDVDFPAEAAHDIFRALIARGIGLEVNVSNLRRGGRPEPDLPLLKLYRACGGEIATVGSDAHNAGDVGANIADGMALLREAGFAHVALYRGRKPEFVAL